ncbi:alpha/beta fold hydrolase [Streptomyces sp. SID5594]|uniref:alpha/beta fold hydrolase n=1 Tax=Streptomyces TaxID=1883 RepID=UPI000361A461|nr:MULTISPECIES: alpha/beta hydrolase [unclassified Streptomyces]MZF53653.1 alpha/beta fold hydrolase [Streptomyces sp. SID5594]
MSIGEFRNDKARERFDAVYGRLLGRLWPDPGDTFDLPTSFGTTRVHRAGPPCSDPVVLLSGANGNSLMWHRYIEPIARRRTVIAVDTVGEPGASVQSAPMTGAEDGARWLEEVLAGLEATAAHLVGCSYGGWLALGHQMHHPGRTAALTLVEPAGFADPGRRFYAWLIAGGLAGMAPRALRPRLSRWVGNSAILETELMELGRASVGFRRVLPPARVFSDEELRRVRVPSLFLLGEQSSLHDARQVAERVGALMPAAEVEVVPGASHALPTDDPELVAARILRHAGE